MSEDIWPEKPEAKRISQIKAWKYDKRAMDAWLEKLKADWEQRELVLQGCEEQGYISINRGAIVVRCGFKEKAEKWDKLIPYLIDRDEEQAIEIYMARAQTTFLTDTLGKCLERKNRLEAIKTACENFYLCKKYETGKTIIDTIWKILEAED